MNFKRFEEALSLLKESLILEKRKMSLYLPRIYKFIKTKAYSQ